MLKSNIYERFIPSIIPPKEEFDDALYFVFRYNKLLVKTSESGISIPQFIDIEGLPLNMESRQYLGELEGYQCCCIEAEIKAEQDISGHYGMEFRELRSLLGLFDDVIFSIAGRAFHILNWSNLNRYCGKCGSKTKQKEDERARLCPECGTVFYPRISPAIIVAVTKGDELLLAHNKNFRNNWYSVIAGFVEPGETFEDCVRREVLEEVGIKVNNINYFGSQPWPFPDSLMVGFTAEYDSGEITPDGVEIGDAGWYKRNSLPDTPTSFSIAGRLINWFKDNNS